GRHSHGLAGGHDPRPEAREGPDAGPPGRGLLDRLALRLGRRLDAQDGVADAQLVALLEGVPAGRRAVRSGLVARQALADLVAVDEGPVEAAQVARRGGGRVDVDLAVVPRDLHEFQAGGQLEVAVARPADDTVPRLGELTLPPLEGAVEESEGYFHCHDRLLSFAGAGDGMYPTPTGASIG